MVKLVRQAMKAENLFLLERTNNPESKFLGSEWEAEREPICGLINC